MHLRNLLASLSLTAAALTLPLAAQSTEWVQNGSFTGTMAPWVLGGAYSVNPGLEVGWDTTGLGISDSYGVNAGGQMTPSPYPPNWIEQSMLVVQGLTYEFRADASGARPNAPTVGNADIGTIWVEVDNVEVARLAFGSYTAGEIKRAQIVGRFTTATSGMVTLRIYFQRAFLGGSSNPRMNLDNVSIRDTVGPTHWIAGNRRIGASASFRVAGEPNAAFLTFIAAGEANPGIQFPGVTGLYQLDPGSSSLFLSGQLDGNGAASVSVPIPSNVPGLLTIPLWYQAGTATATTVALGFHFGVVFTQ